MHTNDLTVTKPTTTTAPTPDASAADLRAALAAADERFGALLFRANADVERAQADNAALLSAVRNWTRHPMESAECNVLFALARAEHPAGDALLTELEAARAIVEEARKRNPVETCSCVYCSSWRALYAAYDAAVKARQK